MRLDPIFVAGATGYVGGRLIPVLLEAGYRVRVMGRTLAKLACRPWAHHDQVELVQGDVLDLKSLRDLLDIYAEEARLPRRLIIPVPILTPTLSALWIHLISPVPKSIALPLTEGLTSDAAAVRLNCRCSQGFYPKG